MSRDPFYAVKDKVSGLLVKLKADYDRFNSVSPHSADYATLSNSLRQQVSAIDTDCKDLGQTIIIVEQNRSRFPTISDTELSSRRSFVSTTLTTLATYNAELRRSAQRAANDNRKQLMQPTHNTASSSSQSRFSQAASSQRDREQDDYVASASQQQQTLIKQQDVVLDDMDQALARLGNISNDINAELVEQDAMLNEMDSQMDEAQGNFGIVLKKMDKLLMTSDRGRICCILGLFFVAVILIIIIVYAS